MSETQDREQVRAAEDEEVKMIDLEQDVPLGESKSRAVELGLASMATPSTEALLALAWHREFPAVTGCAAVREPPLSLCHHPELQECLRTTSTSLSLRFASSCPSSAGWHHLPEGCHLVT